MDERTDREWIMNLVPRMDNAEKRLDKAESRGDKFDNAISELRGSLHETEIRIAGKMDEGFKVVETHLGEQDKRMDTVVSERRHWPTGAVVSVTAVGTLLSGIGVAMVLNLHF